MFELLALITGGIAGVTTSEVLKAKGAPPLLVDVTLTGIGTIGLMESKGLWRIFAGAFAGESAVRALRVILGEPRVIQQEGVTYA